MIGNHKNALLLGILIGGQPQLLPLQIHQHDRPGTMVGQSTPAGDFESRKPINLAEAFLEVAVV